MDSPEHTGAKVYREFRPAEGEPVDDGRLDSLGSKDRPAARKISLICAASLAGKEVQPRAWVVPDLIPDRQVALLTGDGGVGKSLLALQLAVAVATGTDWIGTLPISGPVIYVSCEDEAEELTLRLTDIVASRGLNMTDLGDLHLLPLVAEDPVLAAPGAGGLIAATALWDALDATVAAIRPRLLILDNSADVYAGNEISRTQVRQFVALNRSAAVRHGMAVVLLSHPSLTGLNSGTGTSGSTAWSNSVRARLYLDRPKADDAGPPDPDLRLLRVMKLNYAATGAETRLRWKAGVFRLDASALSSMDRVAGTAAAEDTFLELLAQFAGQGRNVSHQPGPTYAPTLFAKSPIARGITRRGFVVAMERLFATGRIRVEETGRPSKRRNHIVPV